MNKVDSHVKEVASKITLEQAFIADFNYTELHRMGYNKQERAQHAIQAMQNANVPTLSAQAVVAHLEAGKTLVALKL